MHTLNEECDFSARSVHVFCFFEVFTLHRPRFWVESIHFQRVHYDVTPTATCWSASQGKRRYLGQPH